VLTSKGVTAWRRALAHLASSPAPHTPAPRKRQRPGPSLRPPNSSTPWRRLNTGRQALLVLAYLRKEETFAELAAGFGIATATAWRYVTEPALLAARSPKLRKALREAKKARHAYVVIDGTLIPIDRVATDRPFTPAPGPVEVDRLWQA
jgi:hypothetical protein